MCRQWEDGPRLYCQACVFKNRDNYQEFHNHYWRTQLTDHLHCMEVVDSLRSLHQKKAILRYPEVSNDLNDLYKEGLKATKDGHYKEREFPDLSFAQPCDDCGVEITFIMFTCLGCRNMSLCEPCYFRQLQIEEEPTEESSICESERSRSVSPLASDAHLVYAARELKT